MTIATIEQILLGMKMAALDRGEGQNSEIKINRDSIFKVGFNYSIRKKGWEWVVNRNQGLAHYFQSTRGVLEFIKERSE